MLLKAKESLALDREHPKDETGCSRNCVDRNVSPVKSGGLLHLAESAYNEIPRGRRKVLCCPNGIWIHINASFGGDDEEIRIPREVDGKVAPLASMVEFGAL
ncbi:hypothetical protein WR25_20100 [Diploscapter pachys]|uniref:Uncharacterized protein n=1 Tax=Diploscapter pachys TaxID=2018661 RepID=A0A2A2KID2_9BILA|nr:hypothetical protein WR25_20100 [Diploscapter pachys]